MPDGVDDRFAEALTWVPILVSMGIRLIEVRPGFAAAELPPGPNVNRSTIRFRRLR